MDYASRLCILALNIKLRTQKRLSLGLREFNTRWLPFINYYHQNHNIFLICNFVVVNALLVDAIRHFPFIHVGRCDPTISSLAVRVWPLVDIQESEWLSSHDDSDHAQNIQLQANFTCAPKQCMVNYANYGWSRYNCNALSMTNDHTNAIHSNYNQNQTKHKKSIESRF